MAQMTIEELEKQIEAKRIEREEKQKAYNQVDREVKELKRERDRLRYNGMTKHEYIAHLQKNPIIQEVDGITFKIEGYTIHTEYDTPEGEHIYFSDTVYLDQSSPRLSYTANGRNRVFHSYDVPKTKEKLFNKHVEAASKLKMIVPDEDNEQYY